MEGVGWFGRGTVAAEVGCYDMEELGESWKVTAEYFGRASEAM